MVIRGADTERLAALELEIKGVGGRLNELLSREPSFVSRLRQSWLGSDAEGFLGQWQGVDRPALQGVSDRLAEIHEVLRRNRLAQEETSATSEGSGSGASTFPLQGGGGVVIQGPGAIPGDTRLVVDDSAAPDIDLRVVVPPEFTSEEMAAHKALLSADSINELSREQIDLIVGTRPELLLRFDDLPDDLQTRVENRVIEEYEDRLPVVSYDGSVEAELDIAWLSFTGEVQGATTLFRDGSVVIELELTGSAGADFGAGTVDVEGGLEGGVAVEYRFNSTDDARVFLDDLKEQIRPGGNVPGYLNEMAGDLESSRASIGGYVGLEADIKSFEGELRASAGRGYDLVTREAFTYLNGELELDFGELGQVDADAALALVEGSNGQVSTVEVAAALSGQSEVLGKALGLPPGVDPGANVRIEGDLDLTDPVARNAYDRFRSGDGSFADVIDASDLVISTGYQVGGEVEFDATAGGQGLEIEAEYSASANTVSLVKLPHSSAVVAPPHQQCVAPIAFH